MSIRSRRGLTVIVVGAALLFGCAGNSEENGGGDSTDVDAPPVSDAGVISADDSPLGTPWSASHGDPGPLPDRVWLKTNTETHNRAHYFGVRDGGIWAKPNAERTGTEGEWTPLSLPVDLEGRVLEISADDNEMIAITTSREIWTMTGALSDPSQFTWRKEWGFPFWTGPGQSLPEDVRRWEWSVLSPQEDVTWMDPAGNSHVVGLAKVSHIWMLRDNQQTLTYIDPWLPLDFSYRMCGPERSRFRAENLSASGSTIFVINRRGDMFTRLYDFDTSGADTAFFQYSYFDQRGVPAPVIQLPPADWVEHPKIDGEITNLISIYKVGQGAVNRTMRVEGIGPDGATGYYEKDVTELEASAWVFHSTGETLRGEMLDNTAEDTSAEQLGEGRDVTYSRNMAAVDALSADSDIGSPDDWAAEISSFNLFCSPTTLRVHASPDESFDLTLHTTDAIRGEPRAETLDDSPRDVLATIEMPQALADDLPNRSAKVQSFVESYLTGGRFTSVAMHVTTSELTICPGEATLDRSCPPGAWTFTTAK